MRPLPSHLATPREYPQNESNALIVVRTREPGSTGGGMDHPVTESNGLARLRRAGSRSAGRGMKHVKWTRRESNPRPLGCEPSALPAELRALRCAGQWRSPGEPRAQCNAARWNRTSIFRASTGRLDHVGQSGVLRPVRESNPSHPVDSRRPSPEGQRGIRATGENRTHSRLSPRGATVR